jgi:hypothetical protein
MTSIRGVTTPPINHRSQSYTAKQSTSQQPTLNAPQHVLLNATQSLPPQRNQSVSFEMDEIHATGSSGGASWAQRVSWLTRKTERPYTEGAYIGGEMETDAPSIVAQSSIIEGDGLYRNSVNAKYNAAILPTRSSPQHHDDDSLADFKDSDWTPPDSSYGAAIPVGGWIPKNIRRGIEGTLIAMTVLGLVFIVVATSIRITEEAHNLRNSTTHASGTLDLHDDRYIVYGTDDSQKYKNYGQDTTADDFYYAYDDNVTAYDDAIPTDDDGDGDSSQYSDDLYSNGDYYGGR